MTPAIEAALFVLFLAVFWPLVVGAFLYALHRAVAE